MKNFVKIFCITTLLGSSVCFAMTANSTSQMDALNQNRTETIKSTLNKVYLSNSDELKEKSGEIFENIADEIFKELKNGIKGFCKGKDNIQLNEEAKKLATDFYRAMFPKVFSEENPYYHIAQQAIENGDYHYADDMESGKAVSNFHLKGDAEMNDEREEIDKLGENIYSCSKNMYDEYLKYKEDIRFCNLQARLADNGPHIILSSDKSSVQICEELEASKMFLIQALNKQETEDQTALIAMLGELKETKLPQEGEDVWKSEWYELVQSIKCRCWKIAYEPEFKRWNDIFYKICFSKELDAAHKGMEEWLYALLSSITEHYEYARNLGISSFENCKQNTLEYARKNNKIKQKEENIKKELIKNPENILDYYLIRLTPMARILASAIVHEAGHMLHHYCEFVNQKKSEAAVEEAVSVFFELYYAHLNKESDKENGEKTYRLNKKNATIPAMCDVCSRIER